MPSTSASSSQRREFHLHTAIHLEECYCNLYRNFSISLMTLCLACHKYITTFHICSIKIIEKQKTTEVNLLSAFLHKAFVNCQRIEQTTVKSCFINSEKKKATLE